MATYSGWCGVRGRVPAAACSECVRRGIDCDCEGCAKLAQQSGFGTPNRTPERLESEVKRGSDRANESDPLATNLSKQRGGLV